MSSITPVNSGSGIDAPQPLAGMVPFGLLHVAEDQTLPAARGFFELGALIVGRGIDEAEGDLELLGGFRKAGKAVLDEFGGAKHRKGAAPLDRRHPGGIRVGRRDFIGAAGGESRQTKQEWQSKEIAHD